MNGTLDIEGTVRHVYETAEPKSLRVPSGHTIRPPLPSAASLQDPDVRTLLRGALIGAGAMGLVHEAKQTTLDRDVAIKSLQEPTGRAAAALVQEALVTARLEHPNVVPIHDLVFEQGQPQLVMRRIEGVQWAEVMSDPERARAEFGVVDLLEWNLRVLLQVCNAMRLAHARQVVHRDLKPENVMLGAFGEVYVLDWGVAIVTDPAASPLLPRQRSGEGPVGTPQYMAPELLGDRPHDGRTDVFSLGALLFRIATGRPPYVGDTFSDLLVAIASGEPEVPASVPDSLAEIIRRATRRAPDDRHGSIDDFGGALDRCLAERGAERLVREADARVTKLEVPDVEETDRAQLYSEARFGYEQALREVPGFGPARAGLARATKRMVELELTAGNLAAAELFLRQMESPPADVVARIEALRTSARAEREGLEAVALDQSFQPGRRRRRALALPVVGLGMGLTAFGAFAGEPTYGWLFGLQGTAFLGTVLAAVLVARGMPKTRRNQSAIAYALAMTGLPLLFDLGFWISHQAAETTALTHTAVWTCATVLMGGVGDRRFLWVAVWFALGFLAACVWPPRVLLVTAVAVMLAGTHIAVIVAKRQKQLEADDRFVG